MGSSSQFKVRFSGLKEGKHTFEFDVDNSFFEKLEYSQIEQGEVHVSLELTKKSTHMEFDFKLIGWIGEACDRCVVDYHQNVEGEYKVFVKFGEDFEELSDDMIVIPKDEYELDVSQLIYEFIGLSVPLRKVPCEENGDTTICDQAVLDLLEPKDSEREKSNSPWAALKGIKDQLKD